jgi:large subunit ribosomal protein L24
LALRFGEVTQVDGSIESESLDAPAIIAATIGMPAQRGTGGAATGWSTEPFAWSASGLTGRVEFKAQRAVFAPALVAQPLRGVARFGGSEVAFEDIAGELANGRLEGRLAIANGADGLSARVRLGLTDADAGAIFAIAELANAGRPSISGRLAFQTELEGVGRSPAAFIGSLAGFGTVTLEQAELAGLNPGVFDAVTRAVELGIPTDGNRIREFVAGELDKARLPVSRATAAIGINAGQARFRDIVIRVSGVDLEATASVDLANAALHALLTFTGPSTAPGAVRPVVLVALRGPLPAPKRTIDTSLLTSWLMLRAVEQQTKQIDAMERAGREMTPPQLPKPPEPAGDRPPSAPLSITRETLPATSGILPQATGEIPANGQAPALPPPIDIPAAPRPGAAPRAGNEAPSRAIARPPELIGAQH